MSLIITLLLGLALIGALTWGITTLIPMRENIKMLIIAVSGVLALLHVLSAFGIIGGGYTIKFLR
jgi:hypothetical protein